MPTLIARTDVPDGRPVHPGGGGGHHGVVSESDVVATLRRWEGSGAIWQVVGRAAGTVTVALLTCDGGQEVERLSSADPALLAYVADRETSET